MVLEVNIVIASVVVCGFRQSVVAASVVDDGAIVEDGGEVVVEVNIVVASVAVMVSDRVVVATSVVDDGAIVEDGGEVIVEVTVVVLSVAVVGQTELWLLHRLLMLVL